VEGTLSPQVPILRWTPGRFGDYDGAGIGWLEVSGALGAGITDGSRLGGVGAVVGAVVGRSSGGGERAGPWVGVRPLESTIFVIEHGTFAFGVSPVSLDCRSTSASAVFPAATFGSDAVTSPSDPKVTVTPYVWSPVVSLLRTRTVPCSVRAAST
jgi:hypothetical protein